MSVETMENIPEFYILGLPIETEIGILHPVTVGQYPKFVQYIQVLSLQDWQFKQMMKFDEDDELSNNIKDIHFFYIIDTFKDIGGKDNNTIYDIYMHYKSLFEFCFKDDVFGLIDNGEDFDYYRNLILSMNGIEPDIPNPNPEIERYNQLKELLESQKGDSITFNAMYTSVLAFTGQSPNNMTLYQFYKVFDRISHFKNFDITSMYGMVSNEVELNPWYGETKKPEPIIITEEQMRKGSMGLHEGL